MRGKWLIDRRVPQHNCMSNEYLLNHVCAVTLRTASCQLVVSQSTIIFFLFMRLHFFPSITLIPNTSNLKSCSNRAKQQQLNSSRSSMQPIFLILRKLAAYFSLQGAIQRELVNAVTSTIERATSWQFDYPLCAAVNSFFHLQVSLESLLRTAPERAEDLIVLSFWTIVSLYGGITNMIVMISILTTVDLKKRSW